MTIQNWRQQADEELRQAEEARRNGNEGKARVSARRAAGAYLREYLRQQGEEAGHLSAYQTLQLAVSLPQIPAEARQVLEHLVLRVEPGGILPIPVDLVAETRLLPDLLEIVHP